MVWKGLYPTVPGATTRHPRGSWLWYEVELLAIEEDASDGHNHGPAVLLLVAAAGRLRLDRIDATGRSSLRFLWKAGASPAPAQI